MIGADDLAKEQPGYHFSNIHLSRDSKRNLTLICEGREVMLSGMEKVVERMTEERPAVRAWRG